MKRERKSWLGRWWHYLVVLALGAVLTVGIWGYLGEFMRGDDYAFHVVRLQSALNGWQNGQIIPQVDTVAFGGFGYAYNLFYGPLITYAAGAIQLLVAAWPVAINLVLILLLVGSGLLMCRTMTKISGNKVLGALVGVLYMAVPYHLTNLYGRMALGEVAAMTVAPILVLGLYQLVAGERHAARSIAVSAALLVLCHSLSAMLFAFMGLLVVILNIDKVLNVKAIWRMIVAVIVALGLSAFFTLPLVEAKLEGNYGAFNSRYSEVYFGANGQSVNDHRAQPREVMVTDDYTEWPSLAIGLIAVLGLVGFFLVWRQIERKTERRFALTMWIVSVLMLLLMSFVVDWWKLPSLFWTVQFPWRMMEVFAVSISIVEGYVIWVLIKDLTEERQRAAVVVAGVLAILPVLSLIQSGPEWHVNWNDESWKELSSGSLGWQAEYLPMQLLCDPEDEAEVARGYACSLTKAPVIMAERGGEAEVISGKAKVEIAERDGLRVWLKVKAESVSEVELPLVWYPGYRATLGGEELEVKASERLGLVTVVIPAGQSGEVAVWYGLSRATKLGAMISLGTVALGAVWLVFSGIRELKDRKTERDTEMLMRSMRSAVAKAEEAGAPADEVERAFADEAEEFDEDDFEDEEVEDELDVELKAEAAKEEAKAAKKVAKKSTKKAKPVVEAAEPKASVVEPAKPKGAAARKVVNARTAAAKTKVEDKGRASVARVSTSAAVKAAKARMDARKKEGK